MKKSKSLLFAAIVAASFAILAGSALIVYGESDYYGFHSISQKSNRDGTSTIYIKCSEVSGYSVEPVGSDEKAYQGERLVSIPDDLGDYVVRVNLYDADPSNHFAGKYSSWTTYKIDNSGLSFMYAYTPSDGHGTVIYIGSDAPIDVNDVVVKGLTFGSTGRAKN